MPEETIYSFSRINGFSLAESGDGCYYNWYKTYVEGDRGENNFFGEYGTLFHETIEKLMNGEIFDWDVRGEIDKGFKEMKFKAPFPAMKKSYVNAIHNFFDSGCYQEVFSKYKILEAEDEKSFTIGNFKIKGFPDLVVEHEEYGLCIVDYKTAKKYEGEKLEHNLMQLYLYSIPIYEQYGKYPDHLIYIFPREKGQKEFIYPFISEKLEKTKNWAVREIEKLLIHNDWKPRCEIVDSSKDFYANQLCNHRFSCQYKCNKR